MRFWNWIKPGRLTGIGFSLDLGIAAALGFWAFTKYISRLSPEQKTRGLLDSASKAAMSRLSWSALAAIVILRFSAAVRGLVDGVDILL
jgi:hypothetical protein